MSDFWGYHAMFDVAGCNQELIKNKKHIKKFIKTLVNDIDMVAVGKPIVKYLCEGDPKEGYSFVQLIVTSSIVGHLMNSGEAYFDVFSCKPFDASVAQHLIEVFFKPSSVRFNYLTRDAG